MSKPGDKSHSEESLATMKHQWSSLGFFDKVRCATNFSLIFGLGFIPAMLFGKNEMTKNLKQVTGNIYQLEYSTNGIKSNCVIVVG